MKHTGGRFNTFGLICPMKLFEKEDVNENTSVYGFHPVCVHILPPFRQPAVDELQRLWPTASAAIMSHRHRGSQWHHHTHRSSAQESVLYLELWRLSFWRSAVKCDLQQSGERIRWIADRALSRRVSYWSVGARVCAGERENESFAFVGDEVVQLLNLSDASISRINKRHSACEETWECRCSRRVWCGARRIFKWRHSLKKKRSLCEAWALGKA